MTKPKTILLIDDDEDDRWLFSEALSRTVPSVTCLTASGGPEALSTLKGGAPPDLIFLDLNMPGMDGKKFLIQLKSDPQLKSIPVIVYSTSNYHRDIEETKKMGADRFIIKPSEYKQLCDLFRELFL
jgi:CheY-like chemotaxis protein